MKLWTLRLILMVGLTYGAVHVLQHTPLPRWLPVGVVARSCHVYCGSLR